MSINCSPYETSPCHSTELTRENVTENFSTKCYLEEKIPVYFAKVDYCVSWVSRSNEYTSAGTNFISVYSFTVYLGNLPWQLV